MISETIKAKIIEALHARYGSWSGFQDEQFIEDETRYKCKVVADAQPLIAQPVLEELLEQERWDEFLTQLEKAGKRSINLLYLSAPSKGDLKLLHDSKLTGDLRAEFCRTFFQLLYGDGSAPERLGEFVAFLQASELPVYWTFPTYFLFVSDPDRNLLVKPSTIKDFLEFINAGERWSRVPTAEGYRAILDTAAEVGAALKEYGQADLIDVQSVMYVCADVERGKIALSSLEEDTGQDELTLAPPFSDIFASHAQAQQAFSLVHRMLTALGVKDAQNPIFAVTIPKTGGGSVLRVNYGTWWLISFHAKADFYVALKDGLPRLEEHRAYNPFARCRPQISLYRFPMDTLDDLPSMLDPIVEQTLPIIKEFFIGRKECQVIKYNRPTIAKAIFDPPYRQELLAGNISIEPAPEPTGIFEPNTFHLLESFEASPTLKFYHEHQIELQNLVAAPFQHVLREVAKRLPDQIRTVVETEKRLFSSFRKNDFGQGGAWSHYWGAFYPKGSKRSQDAQLSMWINHELFEHGFYIGNYGSTQRQRFSRNCQVHAQILEPILVQLVGDNVRFGNREALAVQPDGTFAYRDGSAPTWADFLQDPSRYNNDVSYFLAPEDLVELEEDVLVERVLDSFRRLFPLVLLATLDEPLAEIEAYVAQEFPELSEEDEAEDDLQPLLPLPDIAVETGFSQAELARWVAAIQRKRQAIFYGPPGTGKTFIARRLAEHLIGGGDGFWELVQFHPAYAYEDFIQGIRPRPTASGGLEYPVVRGRFLEFCQRAAQCKGPCVLIIDEINRANLARVFGELMYLLEYRDETIRLATSDQGFRIPRNVYLIGTMNTADRSIALVDHALRRRFAFIKLEPKYSVLSAFHQKNGADFDPAPLVEVLQEVNRQIGDPHYAVGISFFLRDALSGDLEDIWRMEIEPYLEEYFFDQRDLVKKFSWEQVAPRLLSGGPAHG